MRHSQIKTFILIAFLAISGFSLTAQTVTNAPAHFTPGPNDGRIAYVTARLLEEFHYSQHPFDTEISEKFFDAYLNMLDPQHVHFLQSDIAEFSHYRTNLDNLTVHSHGEADVTPAYKIFARFYKRLQQRVTYVDNLLKHDKFKFDTDQKVLLDRKDAPYPKNLAEAKQLWRRRLLFEFLQEKLNREKSPDTTLSATNLTDITQTLTRRYERGLRSFTEWDSGDVLQAYLDSLAHAYDPHSDYLNDEHAQDFSISMSLALFGIGAELTSEDGYCKIESLIPGGPAAKSNQLKENDKIVAVAQGKGAPVDVVDMELSQVVQLIRGPKGTEVRLTIIPEDDPNSRRVVTLIRDEIKLKDQEAKAALIELPDGHGVTNRLGIIDLPSFYATVDLPGNIGNTTPTSATADTAKLIKKLEQEKVQGIILDLRNNPGGSLEEAIEFTGLFITNGPVVQVRSPDGRAIPDSNTSALDLYHGPLVVMVNRFSASAAEIVAAALQDYGRALLVGDTSTHGKGTVQNLNPLRPFWPDTLTATNDPGTVKITIRKFYRVNGESTQLKGVTPDIILPDTLSYRDDIGESSLPNALPWDTIQSADYDKMNLVQPYLAELQKLSDARVATNQDFIYVRQDIAELKKLQAENTATLNERQAWKEKEEMDARKKAREKEIAARKLPDETIYEITVADATKPGLPTPMPLLATNGITLDESNSFKAFFTNSVSQTTTTNSISQTTNSVVKLLQPDPVLTESEHILENYISLWPTTKH